MEILNKLPEKFRKNGAPLVEALLNLIPYAGGSMASVFSNYRSDKKTEKILEAVDELANIVNINGIVIEKLLTEDQVCELLERHLVEIGINSDESKNEYLKASLKKAFTSEAHQYEEKEIFLNIIKDLTGLEITLLKHIYLRSDPFVETVYPQDPPIFSPNENNQLHVTTYLDRYGNSIGGLHNGFHNNFNSLDTSKFTKPYHYEIDNVSFEMKPSTLESYFKIEYPKNWISMNGAIAKLDAKGLTNIKENLGRSTVKVVKMKFVEKELHEFSKSLIGQSNHAAFGLGSLTVTEAIENKPAKTPIEGSKTDFGEEFIKYITY